MHKKKSTMSKILLNLLSIQLWSKIGYGYIYLMVPCFIFQHEVVQVSGDSFSGPSNRK